jgi:hypothetical protein
MALNFASTLYSIRYRIEKQYWGKQVDFIIRKLLQRVMGLAVSFSRCVTLALTVAILKVISFIHIPVAPSGA